MNTIIDLNVATTVTYNEESSYSITFGTNFGNTTSNVDAYTSANITNQCNVTALSNAVRDLLIDVAFSNVGNVSVAYDGTFGNIGVLQIAPAAWRVTGIRTTGQYTEAMANVKYTDLTGASNVTPEYSYTTTVNDQAGNTRTWTTTVNVIQLPELAVSGPVIYDEDISANVTVLSVVVDPASLVPFTLYANVAAANGTVSNGIVVGNSVSISGNATQLNALLTANTITYLPASDLASNVTNAITFALGNATTIFDTASANIQIANTHAEYAWANTGVYDEDTRFSFGNTITDLDTHALSYTLTFQQTAGNQGKFYLNGAFAGNANTAYTVTNTKANLNNTVSWQPAVDDVGNVTIAYTQVKTLATGNVTQASAVTKVLSIGNTNPEIANMIARSYSSNTVNNIFAANTPQIDDGPDYGQTYTITLTSPAGQFGNAYATLANTYTFTGSRTQVNSNFANIIFAPFRGQSANSNFTYTQVRDGTTQVNTALNLTGIAVALANTTEQLFVGTTSWLPSLQRSLYQNANVILVGGGGGASGTLSSFEAGTRVNPGGSGGGGGGVVEISNVQIAYQTYTVSIGNGGSAGNSSPGQAFPNSVNGGNGGNTSITGGIFANTAGGGLGGTNNFGFAGAIGGTSGAPQSNPGGNDSSIYSASQVKGGGGGGAGGSGGNAPNAQVGGDGGGGLVTSAGTFGAGGRGRLSTQTIPSGINSYGLGGFYSTPPSQGQPSGGGSGTIIIQWFTP